MNKSLYKKVWRIIYKNNKIKIILHLYQTINLFIYTLYGLIFYYFFSLLLKQNVKL